MATFIVSFRIEYDATYTDRWSSVVDAIHAEAENDAFWEETSSLVVLKSQYSADALAMSIYVGSKFSPTRDKLLVVNASDGSYATRGDIDYPATLAALFAENRATAGLGRSIFG